MTAQVNWVINSMDRDISSGGVKDVEWSCIGRDSKDTAASVTNSSNTVFTPDASKACLLYTSPRPRDLSTSRMPSSA